MINHIKSFRKIFVFVFFAYILLQFLWWEFLFYRNYHDLLDFKKQLTALQTTDVNTMNQKMAYLDNEFFRKKLMIIGEGTIFLLLLVLGFYWIICLEQKDKHRLREREYFFTGITHELKTPITSLRLQLQALLRTRTLNPEISDHIRQALSDADRMNFLINNLLQSRQLMYGRISPQLVSLNISEFIVKTLAKLNDQQRKRIKLEISDSVKNAQVLADEEMSVSIINNLVQNALGYSHENSMVYVQLKKDNDKILFQVKNEGKPFHEKFLKEMFMPFKRIENTSTGNGLGLFVSKSFCERMGHRLNYYFECGMHIFEWKMKQQN
ncbi:MAG: HAMP domain-containing histidine kinase [Bacteroidia bacterium]|nr:HAMP domain-containing histidine kinase [Bacteroidia bacterium]